MNNELLMEQFLKVLANSVGDADIVQFMNKFRDSNRACIDAGTVYQMQRMQGASKEDAFKAALTRIAQAP